MRIACLLVLSCVLPFIALSQIPPDKAIIDDYAQPSFARLMKDSGYASIINDVPGIYVVGGPPEYLQRTWWSHCTVLRHLSPQHAIVRITSRSWPTLNPFRFILPANNYWKLSPALTQQIKQGKTNLRLLVSVSNGQAISGGLTIQEYAEGMLLVQISGKRSLDSLLQSDNLIFADLADRKAVEELSVSGFDLGTNNVNTAHHYFPAITGEGLMVSVKENRFDSNDIDLKGRVISTSIASPTISGHANIMATMIAGAGNSFYDGKGVAPRANLQSASFTNLMPEAETFYRQQGISVQNHSYGTGIENFYGADAAAYDALVVNNPTLMHVFSAGNSGQQTSNGPYAGINANANITGSFKMAKNILVVGAIDSIGNIELPSSRGPAYDGRIKPELVAFGQDGSSGAAAVVSGIVLLVQHAYKQLHHDSLPPVALIRSILVNTAEDVGAAGPDFASGFGKANAYGAVHATRQSHFYSNNIQQGNTQSFNLNITPNITSVKLTMSWTDPAAQANTLKALVNNLDMEFVHVPSGQTWHPWILSSFPHKDSLQLPAVRGRDTLNNIEQITVQAPPPGNYNIIIKGTRVTTTDQQYFVSYSADSANTFQWMYPMSADPVVGGTTSMARWRANFSASTTGTLQYNPGNGNWQTVANNVDLSKNYVRWSAPDVFSVALLRMVVGSTNYSTDTFVISKLIGTQVGFNCPDSFLFYWRKSPGVNSFRVYQLGNRYLEPVTVTADTFYLASKNSTSSKQFTIAPIINNREGFKSYTFDYTTQGVECYFKSFLAQLNGNQAHLSLELGSVYRVSRILIQKLSGNSFQTIQTINNPSGLQFNVTDASLGQGVNTYRAAIQLQDGRLIYSNTDVVYYLATTAYLLYPNPAPVYGGFKILQQQPDLIRVLVHDATGRLVKDEIQQGLVVTITTLGLQKGLYFVTIVKEDKKEFRGKIVIGR